MVIDVVYLYAMGLPCMQNITEEFAFLFICLLYLHNKILIIYSRKADYQGGENVSEC